MARQVKVRIQDPKIHLLAEALPPPGSGVSCLATGVRELDQLLKGGLPRGRISEITGSLSSGRTAILFSTLAQAVVQGEVVAYIDLFDSFDPEFAQKAGIDLKRLLWVRCRGKGREGALKAADILVQAGGFGIIALDLIPLSPQKRGASISSHVWFRLQRAIQGTSTLLLIVTSHRISGTAATTVLSLERQESRWNQLKSQPKHWPVSPRSSPRSSSADHPAGLSIQLNPYFNGIESDVNLLRGGTHGAVKVHCRF